jgi:hypothetical protein
LELEILRFDNSVQRWHLKSGQPAIDSAEAPGHSGVSLSVAGQVAETAPDWDASGGTCAASAVIGATSLQQLKANIDAVDWALSVDAMDALRGPARAHSVRIVSTDQGLLLVNRN